MRVGQGPRTGRSRSAAVWASRPSKDATVAPASSAASRTQQSGIFSPVRARSCARRTALSGGKGSSFTSRARRAVSADSNRPSRAGTPSTPALASGWAPSYAAAAPATGAVESPAGFGRVEVSHVNLNDNVVEGLNALDIPAFSVQYHPEAAAGPHDANYLFDRFRDLVVDHLHETSSPATDQTESN